MPMNAKKTKPIISKKTKKIIEKIKISPPPPKKNHFNVKA
jgi:hypothetical protein